MNPPKPVETKLVISSYHRFTLWRSPPEMAAGVRHRWPEMRVVDLPHYDRITPELPDTDIFVGLVLRPEQLREAKRLKWVHTTSAGVGQLMYPEFRSSGILLTNASGVHSPAMAEHITWRWRETSPARCAFKRGRNGRSRRFGMGPRGHGN